MYGPVIDYHTKGKEDEKPSFSILLGYIDMAFRDTLWSYIPKDFSSAPTASTIKVLEVGYGWAYEARVLVAFLEHRNRRKFDVLYTGIDIDKEAIKRSQQLIRKPNYKFIHGDATNLEELLDVNEEFDMLFIANPDVDDQPITWGNILAESRCFIKQEGLFVTTLDCDQEYKTMKKIIELVGYTLISDNENEHQIKRPNNPSIYKKILTSKNPIKMLL